MNSARPVNEYDEIIYVVGDKNELTREIAIKSAISFMLTILSNRHAPITMVMAGYDDDPREIWQIPECLEYMRVFAETCGKIGIPEHLPHRLTADSLRWQGLGMPTIN